VLLLAGAWAPFSNKIFALSLASVSIRAMHVAEHLSKATRPLFSFEVVPPSRGHKAEVLFDIVSQLQPFNPSWIDVTSHAPFAQYHERRDGTVERVVSKKRPGTLGICGVIQNRFKIDTVSHILCLGFTREETEDALIELNYLGVHNVLALRGDGPNFEKKHSPGKTINSSARDLVEQMRLLKDGKYVSDLSEPQPLDFCVGVAGYPEKHFESPNMSSDIMWLKAKVDAGAEYIVTQMFFDNSKYFAFVDACRAAGIKVPIVPGIKVLKSAGQLKSIPKTFHCDIPADFVDEMRKAGDRAHEVGVRFALAQCRDLLERKAPSLHFYVLNDADHVANVMKGLKL
jgi:methylenetetrahydrofolate reductase (NADPH)